MPQSSVAAQVWMSPSLLVGIVYVNVVQYASVYTLYKARFPGTKKSACFLSKELVLDV